MKEQLLQQCTGNVPQDHMDIPVQSSARQEMPSDSGRPVKVAAFLLLFFVVNCFCFCASKPEKLASQPVWQEYRSASQVQLVRLADRSKVWLNAGSSIRFDSVFSEGKRACWLNGEAYFEVEPMDSLPFEVHAGRLITRALGTAFNIDAYHPVDSVAITVKSGTVAVSDSVRELGQVSADEWIICRADGSVQKAVTPAAARMAWASDQFVLHGMPLGEVVQRLQRKYGVAFVFQDSARINCPVTDSFGHTVSLKEMLGRIARASGSEIRQGQDAVTYYIAGKGKCR